jgi:hypothetical protein
MSERDIRPVRTTAYRWNIVAHFPEAGITLPRWAELGMNALRKSQRDEWSKLTGDLELAVTPRHEDHRRVVFRNVYHHGKLTRETGRAMVPWAGPPVSLII